MEKNSLPLEKILLYYEVNLHVMNGIFPDLHQCISCGNTETGKSVKIDLEAGGALCSNCSVNRPTEDSYDVDSLFILDNASKSEFSSFVVTEVKKGIIIQAMNIISRFTSFYLGKELKSRNMMESTILGNK